MGAKVMKLVEANEQLKQMQQIFAAQQKAFRSNPMPTHKQRVKDLRKLRRALMSYKDRIIKAIASDFDGRSTDETKFAEIMTSLMSIDYTVKHLKEWMAPVRKKVSPLFQPASSFVQYQPLGVIGIIAPWNYPVSLSIGPLISALGAGNRAMIKMSEFTPNTNEVVKKMLSEIFAEDQVAVIQGEVEVAAEFAAIPWNHLLFTGSTRVGRIVMKAAAENLTPVTLELGGKSPCIISDTADLDAALPSIVFGKGFNAGQTCVSPDYVLCPEDQIGHFVERFKYHLSKMYPTLKNNPHYTSIINPHQHQRLKSWLKDAQDKGATIIECNHAHEDFSKDTRKLPIHLVLNASEDMILMQEEIFGPVLPIVPIRSLDEALKYVTDRPSPLALYYFGNDRDEQQRVLEEVHSGGVCINDTLTHFAQEDLHFGGVGESGMGAYHGEQGFLTFSHAKSVLSKNLFNSTRLFHPPYGTPVHKMIYSIFLR
jgi:coniferyl-aldehyde dehydrogenase